MTDIAEKKNHRILVIRREGISKWGCDVRHTLEQLEGEDPDEDYSYVHADFATQAELDAFCEGLQFGIVFSEDYVTYTDESDIRELGDKLGLEIEF